MHSVNGLRFQTGRPLRAVMPLALLDVAGVVVSDTGLPPEYQDMLRAHDVQLLLA